MKDVEGDNKKDVELWNLYENIPIGNFQPLDYALAFSASGSYRFDRDVAVTFAVSNFRKEVVASYHGDQVSLDLRRDVGSTDFKVGLAYYLPPAIYRVESYVLVEVGVMNSRATATAFGTKTEKAADSTLTTTTYDSEGVYEKSKMFVTAGVGATSMMFSNVFMKLEAIYKFARIGTIDGQLRRFAVTNPHTTSIEFDYSGFFITIGFGIEL